MNIQFIYEIYNKGKNSRLVFIEQPVHCNIALLFSMEVNVNR